MKELTKEDVKQFKIHPSTLQYPADLYIFTIDQLNEFIASLEKQIEEEEKININTPFFGNSGARLGVSDSNITDGKSHSDSGSSQQLDGDYDVHFPFKPPRGKRYKLISIEVTDADIEAWADKTATITTGESKHGHIIKAALFTGAKSMRDGEIKKIEK